VALSRGRFNSITLSGQDGVQGPYQLPDETGNTGVLVIAGSEQIWLDGIPLTRGQQQDYIVDYSTGEITFSNRHVITADSRITVDYEFAADNGVNTLLVPIPSQPIRCTVMTLSSHDWDVTRRDNYWGITVEYIATGGTQLTSSSGSIRGSGHRSG
jgi:hypothetical protein